MTKSKKIIEAAMPIKETKGFNWNCRFKRNLSERLNITPGVLIQEYELSQRISDSR